MRTFYMVRVLGFVNAEDKDEAKVLHADEVIVQTCDLVMHPMAQGETANEYLLRMVQAAAEHKLHFYRWIEAWDIARVDVEGLERTYKPLVKFHPWEQATWDDWYAPLPTRNL